MLSAQPTDVGRGNDVLGQIFGSKDVSRTVALDASNRSGLDQGVLKRMLPMLAMMIAGYMARGRGGSTAGQSASVGVGLGKPWAACSAAVAAASQASAGLRRCST